MEYKIIIFNIHLLFFYCFLELNNDPREYKIILIIII